MLSEYSWFFSLLTAVLRKISVAVVWAFVLAALSASESWGSGSLFISVLKESIAAITDFVFSILIMES